MLIGHGVLTPRKCERNRLFLSVGPVKWRPQRRGYTDQEVAAIASFFAEQPWVSTNRTANATLSHCGQEIHDAQCETCHGDGGRAQEDASPRLAGQWSDYTRYALGNCRAEGKRCDPRKMGERVMTLSDEELEALAQYYESQK